MKAVLIAEKRGFTQGVVYSVALLIRCGREGSAEMLWHESCLTLNDLKECDDYDASEVKTYLERHNIS